MSDENTVTHIAGRYEVLQPLEGGALARVLKCRDIYLDRPVIIKSLDIPTKHRYMFEELRALQTVRSKNVIEVFDVVYVPHLAIVEEFIDGKDLRGAKIAPDNMLPYLYQLSSGLTDVHVHGVIHRDVKPGNIMLTGDDIVKIIDFNLARADGDGATVGFVGTHGYAAPELYQGGRVEFTNEVDIYALAATFASLLLGDPPAPLTQVPPAPEAWVANGGFKNLVDDQRLAELLNRALSRTPSERPRMKEICEWSHRLLVKGRHRARFMSTTDHAVHDVSAANPAVVIEHHHHGNLVGRVQVNYDGLEFVVAAVEGDVWMNNVEVVPGLRIPPSSVLAFGSTERHWKERDFVTMDVSHPDFVR